MKRLLLTFMVLVAGALIFDVSIGSPQATAATANPKNDGQGTLLRCGTPFDVKISGTWYPLSHCYVSQVKCPVSCYIYCYSQASLGQSAQRVVCANSIECLTPMQCNYNHYVKPTSGCAAPNFAPCRRDWGAECPQVEASRQACLRDRFNSPCADTDGTEVRCE
jgi:hypothetical protein